MRTPATILLIILTVAPRSSARTAATNRFSSWSDERKKAYLAELVAGLKSPNPIAQKSSIIAMGQLGLKEGAAPLIEALTNRARRYDQVARMELIGALGRLHDRRATRHLLVYVGGDDDLLCGAAMLALGSIGDPEAVPVLIGKLGAGPLLMRHMAMTALANIGDERAVVGLEYIARKETNEFLKGEAARFAKKIKEKTRSGKK